MVKRLFIMCEKRLRTKTKHLKNSVRKRSPQAAFYYIANIRYCEKELRKAPL